ncbi:MAG: autotransporter assembly complex protein TamA [Thiohalocapsa sp.]|uniref:autotransporter assembly complex protein TamA n=1 Tax=Thiohalocapsa sp. TaxID=2497641 RepID=UPI0025D6E74E|nr:autotransporter assembly complex family protein [Thiohalocapsa sp.]MCG6943631.1 autotransporter assembly complex protein TamA [Thiohalocapsa sp.]
MPSAISQRWCQLVRRRSRARRVLLCIALCLPLPAAAVSLQVNVEGVEGQERKNVLALLAIYQEQGKKNLTVPLLLALHRRAPEQIRNALAPFGLYRVQVQDSLKQPEQGNDRWVATYRIDPGQPVKIASVDYQITGAGADNPAFPKKFPMQPGDVLLHADYDKAKNEITAIASEQGYLDADLVRHVVLIDPVAYDAHIEFHLETGPRFYFGHVTFKQDLLSDAYLKKFVDFKPGDVYDPDLLLQLQGNLVAMEYYKNVEIVPLMDQAGPDHQVPIRVVAERNKPNKYLVGVGYATDIGPRFSLDYRRRYIGPRGHKLKAEIQVAPVTQSLVADYRIPFRNPLSDYYVIRPELYSYDTASRQGTQFKVGAAQSILTRSGWRRDIGVDYRYEDYKITDEPNNTFNGLVPYVAWSRVDADDPINTKNGYRVRFLVQGTARNVLSETSFLSGTASVKWIKTLGARNRFITRADLGATWAPSLQDVPASQRFFAGGDSSIRGWGLDALGPIDPATGQVVGGRFLAVGSLEYDRTIKGPWGVAVFTDFGNAFDPTYNSAWEQSVGGGLRFATPIGPIRVDLAYAITKDPAGFRLHLGLGPDL